MDVILDFMIGGFFGAWIGLGYAAIRNFRHDWGWKKTAAIVCFLPIVIYIIIMKEWVRIR